MGEVFFKFLWPPQEHMNFNSGSLTRWTNFNILWLILDYRAKDKYEVVPNKPPGFNLVYRAKDPLLSHCVRTYR